MPRTRGHVVIKTEYCKGCDLCVEECPQDCLQMSRNINQHGYHYAILIEDTCTGCINCALVCPEAIISVYREGKKKHASALLNIGEDVVFGVN